MRVHLVSTPLESIPLRSGWATSAPLLFTPSAKNVDASARRLASLVHDLRPSSLLVDSGAFVIGSKMLRTGKKPSLKQIERRTHAYVELLETLWHAGLRFTAAAEMDLHMMYGAKQVNRWREGLFFPLQQRCPGLTILFCWHREDDELWGDAWAHMLSDRRIRYLALSWGLATKGEATLDGAAVMVRQAYSLGTPVHGFAAVRPGVLRRVPFASVDSVTWASALIYGSLVSFDNRTGQIRLSNAGWGSVKRRGLARTMAFYLKHRKRAYLPSDVLQKGKAWQNMELLEEAAKVYGEMQAWYTQLWKARGIDWDEAVWNQREIPQEEASG